jgi:hypothetical protein
VALGVSVVFTVWGVDAYLKQKASRFDSTIWRDESLGESLGDVRFRMVEDMLASHRLVGMSRTDVLKLLGTPTSFDEEHESGLIYYLGTGDQWIPIDPYILEIRFDVNGLVATVTKRIT